MWWCRKDGASQQLQRFRFGLSQTKLAFYAPQGLTDCPICFRIQSEIVFLVFQATPSLLGLLSSLSPGDGGALPFPPVCLFPSNRILAAESRIPPIISHPKLSPCPWPAVILHFSAKFHSNKVLSPGIQYSFSPLFLLLSTQLWVTHSTLRLWMSFFCGFVCHCASSWAQTGKNRKCNVFEGIIWYLKILLQNCLIGSCLMFKFPLVHYLTGECHTHLAFKGNRLFWWI